MIGKISVKETSQHPNISLPTFYIIKDSASQVRITGVPKNIGDWKVDSLSVNFTLPTENENSIECYKCGMYWIGSMPVAPLSGEGTIKICARGTDERLSSVSNYILGVGKIEVITA